MLLLFEVVFVFALARIYTLALTHKTPLLSVCGAHMWIFTPWSRWFSYFVVLAQHAKKPPTLRRPPQQEGDAFQPIHTCGQLLRVNHIEQTFQTNKLIFFHSIRFAQKNHPSWMETYPVLNLLKLGLGQIILGAVMLNYFPNKIAWTKKKLCYICTKISTTIISLWH